ncbi:serine hydrolase domain-containing protein [Arcanobacterium phocae]|uniref:serine hydrolase domain-containing protein n=1 Tax=Arcanobacterium phocae TaxID=131112 RepID=UPI001C0EBB64|nr:serine hydrolase domain-containing protein [Arcanobacterium phocae]
MYEDFLPADTLAFDHSYMTLTAGSCGVEIAGIAGDPDVVYPLASVTKPIAAWSVLVAVERGLVSLDEQAGPEGSTIRHLLAHASGLSSAAGDPIAAPGTRRIYSNYGFDVLGEAVAARVGMSIQDWVRQTVLEPVRMLDASVDGSIAFSGRASLDSVARFAGELLDPQLISPDLAQQAFSPQFAGIPGILPGYGRQSDNLWGLGLEIRGTKSPHWTGSDFPTTTFGHFGQSGSFVWVDPVANQAGVFLGNRMFGHEHAEVWPELTNQMRAS